MCYYVVTTRGASVGGVVIYGILGTLYWQNIYVILVVLGDLLMVTGYHPNIPVLLPAVSYLFLCLAFNSVYFHFSQKQDPAMGLETWQMWSKV